MLLPPLTEVWDDDLRSGDPLSFPGYADALSRADGESVRTGRTADYAVVEGHFEHFGGSMGVVHGERVVRAIDRAIEARLPLVVVVRSGGARMQEGMFSLIQMGRTAAAMGRHRAAGLLSVALLRSPSTGGVGASYASLCDLVAAEAGATVGFAGPRVAETVTGDPIDGRSHTAETAFGAGLVDYVGDEDALARWLEGALGTTDTQLPARDLEPGQPLAGSDAEDQSAWAEVQRARRADRPTGIDVAAALTTSWIELGGTDRTIRAALATASGIRLVVLAFDRHHGNGRPTPAGFRQAQRAIALAGRLGLPIVTLIDTPGAEPGADAELDGASRAIAETFLAMAEAPVPTVGVCVGEGGSGGALAFGVTDRLLVQEHAVFSVIGPEGAAAILHRDPGRAAEVAEHLGLTSGSLRDAGIVDAVVPDDVAATAAAIVEALGDARQGQRLERFDAATAPWLRTNE